MSTVIQESQRVVIEIHVKPIKGQEVVSREKGGILFGHRIVVNGVDMGYTSATLDIDGLMWITLKGVIPEQWEHLEPDDYLEGTDLAAEIIVLPVSDLRVLTSGSPEAEATITAQKNEESLTQLQKILGKT